MAKLAVVLDACVLFPMYLFRSNRESFAAAQKFKGDLAAQGEDLIDPPIKRPRNRELTKEQKQENKNFDSQGILVEYRIRLLKIFRVFQERFRLIPQKYERVIMTICGLVRFRIKSLILPGVKAPILLF